jgi:hypothetical protein
LHWPFPPPTPHPRPAQGVREMLAPGRQAESWGSWYLGPQWTHTPEAPWPSTKGWTCSVGRSAFRAVMKSQSHPKPRKLSPAPGHWEQKPSPRRTLAHEGPRPYLAQRLRQPLLLPPQESYTRRETPTAGSVREHVSNCTRHRPVEKYRGKPS